jgi:membrane protein YdbS with pleckstrin-like domain
MTVEANAPDVTDLTALTHVEPGYRNVLRLRLLMLWLPLIVGGIVLDQFALDDSPVQGALTVALPLFAAIALTAAPNRIYARLRYGLSGRLLQVVRGWLFHVDTVVPFVRVQHVDVTRGPFDKMFGTASLVVHTAGTHNSIVTLPGLSPGRAAEIRDVIREHVRTDFE